MSKQFINPFEPDLDKDKLYSLISGIPVDEVIVESLLAISQNGQEAMDSFINRLTVEEHKETFSDTIKKNRLKTFQDDFVKAKVSKNGK